MDLPTARDEKLCQKERAAGGPLLRWKGQVLARTGHIQGNEQSELNEQELEGLSWGATPVSTQNYHQGTESAKDTVRKDQAK